MSDEADNKIEPLAAGSLHYYLVRFSPYPLKARQQSLFLWSRELQRITEISDPGVARLRLDWWRKQLAADQISESRHPLAQELNLSLAEQSRLPELVFDMIAATEQRIVEPSPPSWESFWERHASLGGNLASLLETPYGDYHDDTRSIGALNEAVSLLQGLGYYLRQGKFPFPKGYLESDSGDPRRLLEKESVGVIDEILGEIEDRFDQLSKSTPAGPAGVEFAVAKRIANVLRDDPAAIYSARIDLTPLRKLWMIWRKKAAMRQ